jgi:hypothetical protein
MSLLYALPDAGGMDNHQIPLLLTRLLCEADDPRATSTDIKRVMELSETALGKVPDWRHLPLCRQRSDVASTA